MPFRIALLTVFAFSATATAQQSGPVVIRPDTVGWTKYLPAPGIETMSLVGQGRTSGVYAARVRFAPNTTLPPHTHPDERYTLVLHGTLYVGFGEVFDPSRLVAVPEGGLYVAPAGVAHFLWSREEVIYQESGTNPTYTHYLDQRRPS
jgi:quercetin dioxygenase-like cupin family protein